MIPQLGERVPSGCSFLLPVGSSLRAAGEGSICLGFESVPFPMTRNSFSHQSSGVLCYSVPGTHINTGEFQCWEAWLWGMAVGKLFCQLFLYACWRSVLSLHISQRHVFSRCSQLFGDLNLDLGLLRRDWLHGRTSLLFSSIAWTLLFIIGFEPTHKKWRGLLRKSCM
jgi:hypothetical protein